MKRSINGMLVIVGVDRRCVVTPAIARLFLQVGRCHLFLVPVGLFTLILRGLLLLERRGCFLNLGIFKALRLP